MGKRDFSLHTLGACPRIHLCWQKALLFVQDGYAETFNELMTTTEWTKLRPPNPENPKCANCMVDSGSKPPGWITPSAAQRFVRGGQGNLLFTKNDGRQAYRMLNEPVRPVHVVQFR